MIQGANAISGPKVETEHSVSNRGIRVQADEEVHHLFIQDREMNANSLAAENARTVSMSRSLTYLEVYLS